MDGHRSPPATLMLALAAALLAPACTSRDEKAATGAAIAADAFQAGQLVVARKEIDKALAARDDVSDYWLLSARIGLAEGSYGLAFEAYENALTLDRGNAEALTRLCQIALSANQAVRAERYAEQLLALHPGDKAALTVQAVMAQARGDKAGATRLLDQVLAADPADPAALMAKSNLLAADGDEAGAARAAEAALASPGDPNGRLMALKRLYTKSGDTAGYRRTVARLAQANPGSPTAQLDQARSLYETGDALAALAITRAMLKRQPDDVATADAVLQLWAAQGREAMPDYAIVDHAGGGSLETRAAFAQYATVTGRPAIALAILGDAAERTTATAANADAKASRAHARVLTGALAPAAAEIAAVLAVDADQPRALVARAALRQRQGDRAGAIEDLRHALAGNPDDANARLTLAELQATGGDAVLAIATLQDGLDEEDPDPRLATRLAALLRAQGRGAEATATITSFTRDHPFAPRPRG